MVQESLESSMSAPTDIPKHLLSKALKEIEKDDEEFDDDDETEESESEATLTDEESDDTETVRSELSEADEDDDDDDVGLDELSQLQSRWDGQGKEKRYFEEFIDHARDLKELGEYEKAIMVLNEGSAKHPEDLDSLHLRHEIYTLMGFEGALMKKLAKAIKDLKETQELDEYVTFYTKEDLYDEEVSSTEEEDSDTEVETDMTPEEKKMRIRAKKEAKEREEDKDWSGDSDDESDDDEEVAPVTMRTRHSRACKQGINYCEE